MKRSWAFSRGNSLCKVLEEGRRPCGTGRSYFGVADEWVVTCHKIGHPGRKSSVGLGLSGNIFPQTLHSYPVVTRTQKKQPSSDLASSPFPASLSHPPCQWPSKQCPRLFAEHPLTWERMQFGAGGIGRVGGGLRADSFLSTWGPAPGGFLGGLRRCAGKGTGGELPCR